MVRSRESRAVVMFEDPGHSATPVRFDQQAVYRELRRRIVHLEMAPGMRLREQALAAEFGLSRTPIRRVLDRLAHEGLVVLDLGSGASVAPLDFRALREVWALRLKINELVADFVTLPAPAPAPVHARLDDCLARLATVSNHRELVALYDVYHETMLELMTNGPLRSIYDQLYAQTARVVVQMLPSMDLAVEIAAVGEEIGATIEVCRSGSAAELAELRTDHMHMLLARINEALVLLPPALRRHAEFT